MTVTSPPFMPFSRLTVQSNQSGTINTSAAGTSSNPVFSADNGATWLDANGTNTYAIAGVATTVHIVWLGDVTSINFDSDSLTVVPATLPATLTSASNMFDDNGSMTGSIPAFPTGLTNALNMYRDCPGLTGTIPALPPGLRNAGFTFFNCTGLTGSIPAFPDTITTLNHFARNCTGLTGTIPALPSDLINGEAAFRNCTGLTGVLPAFPSLLRNADSMFRGITGLTGTIPALPAAFEDGSSMLRGCTGLTGNIPAIPTTLTAAVSMFSGCTGLSYVSGTLAATTCEVWTNAFSDCAFTQAEVDAMFADLLTAVNNAAIANPANLVFGVDGGTSAGPSAAGIADRDALIAQGATITHN